VLAALPDLKGTEPIYSPSIGMCSVPAEQERFFFFFWNNVFTVTCEEQMKRGNVGVAYVGVADVESGDER